MKRHQGKQRAMGKGQWAIVNSQGSIFDVQCSMGIRQSAKGKRGLLPIACRLLLIGLLLIGQSACNVKSKGGHPEKEEAANGKQVYTCSMHPHFLSDKPGNCPVCGMVLIKKVTDGRAMVDVKLASLLKPTSEFVVSSIPVTTIQKKDEQVEIEALGNIAYDTREIGGISSRVAGRIEKLYIHYRYQLIKKGGHIMDIYSPELLTAQQNLLFLIKNDPDNTTLLQAAKDKLLLLGMGNEQLQRIIKLNKPSFTVAVYSNYNGHIHEASTGGAMNTASPGMKDIALITEELSLKEGMYVQKGQTVFVVSNPGQAWALLNIYGDKQDLVKAGNAVRIVPETAPGKDFRATINFIEPFFRKDNKTLTVRVYFNNKDLKIPIGSQVRATIFGNLQGAYWLPEEAVLSLGMDKVVFQKVDGGFRVLKVNTGILYKNHIQVISGLSAMDPVAVNAQYLMDSESFIKIGK